MANHDTHEHNQDEKAEASSGNLPSSVPPALDDMPGIGSLTLSQLPKDRRPNPSTVCEICPASVWLASPKEVKCFCRIMHLMSWTTSEPNHLTHCDGLAMAEEE